ncbi:MAG: DUF4190 domain-containing protein [bacterium]|nr:DUF4190 domain-containing protein [bacterium]
MKKALVYFSLLLLVSCSVQQRKYQKGFYVSRVHHNNSKQDSRSATAPSNKTHYHGDQKKDIQLTTGDREQLAGADILPIHVDPKKAQTGTISPPDSCDVLLFKDGSELLAKVFEIGSDAVKYKRCDNLNGPSYLTRKEDLFMIKYANGTKEVMKSPAVTENKQPVYEEPKFTPRTKTMQPHAPFSLAFGALAVVLSFVFMGMASNYTGNSLAGQGFGIIFVAAIVSAILALVLGSKSYNEIKNNPDVYKGKGLAIPGKTLGIATLAFWLFVFLLVLLILLTI